MDAELAKLVNQAVQDGLTSGSWVVIVIAVIAAGAGAYIGAYLRGKGAHLATKEDFTELMRQIKTQTRATEEIKAEVAEKLAASTERLKAELSVWAGFRNDLLKDMWAAHRAVVDAMTTVILGTQEAEARAQLKAIEADIVTYRYCVHRSIDLLPPRSVELAQHFLEVAYDISASRRPSNDANPLKEIRRYFYENMAIRFRLEEVMPWIMRDGTANRDDGDTVGMALNTDQPIEAHRGAPDHLQDNITVPEVAEDIELDYTDDMPPVRDSGHESSAVGFAAAASLSFQVKKRFGREVIISPRHLYYYARLKGGLPTDQDSGARIQDVVEVLSEQGAVAEEVWPFRAGEFTANPPEEIEDAEHFKITEAKRINDITSLKEALQQFGPLIAGIPLFNSSMSADVMKTGQVPMPGQNEKQAGGLAICIVGCDDKRRLLKFQNAWGTGWGDKGYGYITYEYAAQQIEEAWLLIFVA